MLQKRTYSKILRIQYNNKSSVTINVLGAHVLKHFHHTSLDKSASSIIWYWPKCSDALGR